MPAFDDSQDGLIDDLPDNLPNCMSNRTAGRLLGRLFDGLSTRRTETIVKGISRRYSEAFVVGVQEFIMNTIRRQAGYLPPWFPTNALLYDHWRRRTDRSIPANAHTRCGGPN
ncbi:hypothetical protein EVAR_6994_1 [Eumeta japonica]|uniref:Uncharacterized protein n=1 Tax=Eumeta variegata TaxID=151549 RepID=A0A4C1TJP5_EUMVA|nr:hypothetical protein EVAR_6994_1 [Eumeta japonica]